MIKMTDIHRENEMIVCCAIVEDSKESIAITLNEKNGEIDAGRLPEGYEWCQSHFTYGVRYLRSLAGNPIEADRCTIIWY